MDNNKENQHPNTPTNALYFWYEYPKNRLVYRVKIQKTNDHLLNVEIRKVVGNRDDMFDRTKIYKAVRLDSIDNNTTIINKINDELKILNNNTNPETDKIDNINKNPDKIDNRNKILEHKSLNYPKLINVINTMIQKEKFNGTITIRKGVLRTSYALTGGKRLSKKVRKTKKQKRTKRRKSIKIKNQKRK